MAFLLAHKLTEKLDAAKYLTRYLTHVYGERESAEHREACHAYSEEREQLRLGVLSQRVTLEQLQRYYAHLDHLSDHFDVGEGEGKANLCYVWRDTLREVGGTGVCQQRNLGLERAATAFNMAVTYSRDAERAKQQMTEEGTKSAANSYMLAAACFAELYGDKFRSVLDAHGSDGKNAFITADLSVSSCHALEKLMQAEAQELYLGMAQAKRTSSHAVVAKLASGARELWLEAQRFLRLVQDQHAGGGNSSGSGGSVLGGPWGARIEARVAWLRAEAERRQAAICMENLKMGEGLARLRVAGACLAQAEKIAAASNKKKDGSLGMAFVESVQLVKSELMATLKTVEKDNETIYMETVPLEASLEPVAPYVIVKPKVVSMAGPFTGEENCPDPWRGLVSPDEFTALKLFQTREQEYTTVQLGRLQTSAEHVSIKLTGACPYNRPCAQQYVGKSQSCMVIKGRLIVHAPVLSGRFFK